MSSTATSQESKRITAFRRKLAKLIPKFPNDKTSLQLLEAKSLGSLLIDYANWMSRYVTPRPRSVHIESTASGDPRWKFLSTEINVFLSKVSAGDDLTAHLSIEPHTKGFTPTASGFGPNVDRWADKDFLLNVMAYHHFHLGLKLEVKGHVARTDVLLFAEVTREKFNVVGLADHSVFDTDREVTDAMSAERERLWKIFDSRSMRGVPLGSVVIVNPIATSGHSLNHTTSAIRYARLIQDIDPKLDDLDYVKSLYAKTSLPTPSKLNKISWDMSFFRLGLFDRDADSFLSLLDLGRN